MGRVSSRLACVMAVATLSLSACAPSTQDRLARDAAKSVIARATAQYLPGVAVAPFTDCIIENATSSQILTLAADSVTGPTASTWEIISGIHRKPETVQCLLTDGVSALL